MSLILSLISVLFSFLEMELFQTDVLRKEYREFVEKTLPKTFECNYCNKNCCKNHCHFDVTSLNCRTERCLQCKLFNQQMDALMKAGNDKTKSFIYNFVIDESLQFFYNIKKKAVKKQILLKLYGK